MTRANKDNPTFRISAAVVKQLGEELVSDELTAIMELVKNSYDADADWVRITIGTSGAPDSNDLAFRNTSNGYIVIEDNGVGMTYDDINNRWLFISVSHKRQMKERGETTDSGRTPLGDKGLGRLSTQRLGQVLEMFTGQKNQNELHHVAFDWRHFKELEALESVDVHYDIAAKSPSKKGTKLVITELKNPEAWANEAGDKFRGQLSKMIFPFKSERKFSIFLTVNGQPFDLDEINEKLRELAIGRYQLEFSGEDFEIKGILKFSKLQGNSDEKKEILNKLILQDHGRSFYNFLTSKEDNPKYVLTDIKHIGKKGELFSFKRTYNFKKDLSPATIRDGSSSDLLIANPGPFLGEIDEYNLRGTDEVESAFNTLSEYKQLIKNQTGVRIFRDGFGIRPYGFDNQDWLDLRSSQTSGTSFYLLRPENIIGYISIKAKENQKLVEKTDREGFVENAYSENFFNIIRRSIADINLILENTRRSYDLFQKHEAEAIGNISSFSDVKERLIETAKQSKSIERDAAAVAVLLKNTRAKVSAEVKKTKETPLFASAESRKVLTLLEEVEALLTGAQEIFDRVNKILQLANKLENDANYLEPKLNELESQIVQFSELAGLGITAEVFTHEMYNIVDRIGSETDRITREVKKDTSANANFLLYIENVRSFLISTRRQLNHLAPSLRFNRESKQSIKMFSFFEEVKEYYESRSKNKTTIKLKLQEDFNLNVNKGKLTQIVDNIILNSEYWLAAATKSGIDEPIITIEVNDPVIRIYDNGSGVPPAVEETLFQPFVTTKPKGIGRGLGLFITEQLLETMDGRVILATKRNKQNRRYIFEISFEK